jgi:hypothetical protein
LRDALFLLHGFALFHHAGVQPFLDVTHDALVRDPMLDEFDEPFVIQRIEESANVRVEQPAHLLGLEPPFVDFIGTMGLSDFPDSFITVVLLADSRHGLGQHRQVEPGISRLPNGRHRLPCEVLVCVHGV